MVGNTNLCFPLTWDFFFSKRDRRDRRERRKLESDQFNPNEGGSKLHGYEVLTDWSEMGAVDDLTGKT